MRLITVDTDIYLQRAIETISINPVIKEAMTANPRRHIRHAAPNCSDVECANPTAHHQRPDPTRWTLVLSVYHDMLTTPNVSFR